MSVRSAAFLLATISSLCGFDLRGSESAGSGQKKVYVLPIRDKIAPPMVYLVRRGVKEAMEAKADLLLLDMDTNGGYVDVTEENIANLKKFKRQTATVVNKKALFAGAVIFFATQKKIIAPPNGI